MAGRGYEYFDKEVGLGWIDVGMVQYCVVACPEWLRGERRDRHVVSGDASRGPYRYDGLARYTDGRHCAVRRPAAGKRSDWPANSCWRKLYLLCGMERHAGLC